MSDNPNPPISQGQSPSPVSVPPKEQPKTLEDIIRENAPEFLKEIPGNKRAALKVTVERHEISMRRGPLPDPAELAAYNEIIPSGADRIMKMAEEQAAHRIKIESIVVRSQQSQSFIGQLFALIIALFGLGCGAFVAVSGQPVAGAALGGATLVSIVSAFLYSRKERNQESGEKRKQMQEVERRVRNQSGNRRQG